MELPYQIAVLCYLFDQDGRVLLLHRRKEPNVDLYSPVGGKLEQGLGESPADCAVREIQEETGLTVGVSQLHLTGLVSESGYGQSTHWLMFLYEVLVPVSVEPHEFREGRLEWHTREAIDRLPQPETDKKVIWPLFWQYRGKFFCVHIDCQGKELQWFLQQPFKDAVDKSP